MSVFFTHHVSTAQRAWCRRFPVSWVSSFCIFLVPERIRQPPLFHHCVYALNFLSMNMLLKESCTAASGVDAPDVTPMTTSLLISKMKGSVTISPVTVRWVMVLSAWMQSPRLMWKERIPAWTGISNKWAVLDESHPPITRMKSKPKESTFSTNSWMASCRS